MLVFSLSPAGDAPPPAGLPIPRGLPLVAPPARPPDLDGVAAGGGAETETAVALVHAHAAVLTPDRGEEAAPGDATNRRAPAPQTGTETGTGTGTGGDTTPRADEPGTLLNMMDASWPLRSSGVFKKALVPVSSFCGFRCSFPAFSHLN